MLIFLRTKNELVTLNKYNHYFPFLIRIAAIFPEVIEETTGANVPEPVVIDQIRYFFTVLILVTLNRHNVVGYPGFSTQTVIPPEELLNR